MDKVKNEQPMLQIVTRKYVVVKEAKKTITRGSESFGRYVEDIYHEKSREVTGMFDLFTDATMYASLCRSIEQPIHEDITYSFKVYEYYNETGVLKDTKDGSEVSIHELTK